MMLFLVSSDDLDYFYKSDNARKMLFYFQVSFVCMRGNDLIWYK
jgi:hypothetical protein